MCVKEKKSESENEREGLCERENNEIDENNVKNEKWTKERKKSGLRKSRALYKRTVCPCGAAEYSRHSANDNENEVIGRAGTLQKRESISYSFRIN